MRNIIPTDYTSVAWKNEGPLTPAALVATEGFNLPSRQINARHQLKLVEAARIWNSFMAGETDSFLMKEAFQPTREYSFRQLQVMAPTIFHEAMTRSDFLSLTTYVIDRIMLANYAAYPFTYTMVAKINRNIKDFRNVERWTLDGGERTWQVVGELEGFNRFAFSEDKYVYGVAKYEGGQAISWEAVINDDMNIFQEAPARLALGGGRTVEIFVTKLYADANGPHASFYNNGNGNVIDSTGYVPTGTRNPILNYDNLAAALAQFMNARTADGRPINLAVDGVTVVVGDAFLYQYLLNIINSQFLATTVAGAIKGSGAVPADTILNIKNWLGSKINPVFNPELRNIVTAAGVIQKSWWVFATGPRPAMEVGFLQGFDTPQLFRKLSNTARIGGGPIEEMGDFETMSTEIKGMVVVGGTRMDPKGTVASNGSGV